jgi:predicted extracellular nuclease
MKKSFLARLGVGLALATSTLAIPSSAGATPAGDNVVIREVYLNGGSAGSSYTNKFIELYNPTTTSIDVNGWSVQYKASTGTTISASNIVALGDHHIEPGGSFLVQGGGNGTTTTALPTPDVSGGINPSGSTGGVIALSKSSASLDAATPAAMLADTNLVDLIGYGTGNTFEGAAEPAGGYNITTSLSRAANGADTNNNSADFSPLTPPTPVACGAVCGGSGGPVDPPVEATIAEIQGTGTTSPLAGKTATTQGVVTAVYKTGGFSGAYIQTDGTGGAVDLATHTASDGIFVFSSAFAAAVDKGDLVKVTGAVSEFNGLTELSTSTGSFEVLAGPAEGVDPATVSFPLSTAEKESLEGMLLAPQGDFTITNNYATNQYAEIGLAPGTKPFDTPTNVVTPGAPALALQAQNDEKLVTLDDGASTNFFSAANQGTALPWLTADNEVRTGAPVAFDDPVVLDFRNSLWKLQPTQQLVAGGNEPVTIGNTRKAAPEPVGGDLKLGTFNVLNYFTTTAADFVAGGGSCTYYNDRAGNHITANSCTPDGPRGAADDANLNRQQAKIVSAINTLDADVVSLEEIENSAAFGLDRDDALHNLVAALNDAAGAGTWAAVPSPATIPANGEDVIRTAFIYQPAHVETVGTSVALDSTAFTNARAPLAQEFRPAGGAAHEDFLVIVNHFKSKGSGSGVDADQGDGQGASNHARTLQAQALIDFAAARETAAGTDKVFLTGDFNAYNEEDPVGIIEGAGFVNVPRELTNKETYQFGGAVGSLDHVFASTEAFENVTGADIWNINSYESVAREYSRYNYNVTDFYKPGPYRASDHDPEVVGFDSAEPPGPVASTTTATAPAKAAYGSTFNVEAKVEADGDVEPTGTVTVKEGSTLLATRELTDGSVSLPVDAGDLSVDDHTLTVSYSGDAAHQPSSTTVGVEVVKADPGLAATVSTTKYGKSAVVHVTAEAGVSGLVTVTHDGAFAGMGFLVDGVGTVTLGKTAFKPGTYELTVAYGGSETYKSDTTTTSLTVVKGATTTKKGSFTAKVVKNRTHANVPFTVTASGYTVTSGTVRVYRGSKLMGHGTVVNGKVTVRLATFPTSGTHTLVAKYGGTTYNDPSQVTFTLKVLRK